MRKLTSRRGKALYSTGYWMAVAWATVPYRLHQLRLLGHKVAERLHPRPLRRMPAVHY